MRMAGRSDLNLAFEKLTGRSPNDEEIRRMRDIGNALGVADNDAIYLVIMLYEHLISELRSAPVLAAEAVKEITDRTRSASRIVAAEEFQKHRTLEAKSLAAMARDIARATAGRSYLQWAIAAMIVAFVSLSAAGWLGWYSGQKAGHADGYAETQDERANASWGNSAQGKKARRLAKVGVIEMLADCTGPGWKREKGFCVPYVSSDRKVYGWRLPKRS